MTRKLHPSPDPRGVTAFAPATVANVAVGFDVLGFALDGIGDRVTARVDGDDEPGIIVERIEGLVTDLPTDPTRNTAAVAVAALFGDAGPPAGLRLALDKGIPLGSGMGGSAASAVAAVVAANALLDEPLPTSALLPFALAGEAAASGAPHADNAAPSLFGGMTALVEHNPPRVIALPLPDGLSCVVVRPEIRIDTRDARAALAQNVPMARFVEQTMALTGFITGCFRDDTELIGRSMRDLVAGPQRSARIPGFAAAREAALECGALGFAVAGSGPSVFAWVPAGEQAENVADAARRVFEAEGLEARAWISPLGCPGARVIAAPGANE